MIVFVDTETGGLDPTRHALVEVAWATLDEPEPKSLILPHDTRAIDPEAAKVNRYYERGLGNPENWCTAEQVSGFFCLLPGATLCASKPSFDADFLNTYLQGSPYLPPPWNYRMLDIASMFVARFPSAFKISQNGPPGLFRIVEWVNSYDCLDSESGALPAPDHTAAGDVRALVAVFDWMFSDVDGIPGGWR